MHACTHERTHTSKIQPPVLSAIGFSVELLELLKFPFHLANQKENSSSFNKRKKKRKKTPQFSAGTQHLLHHSVLFALQGKSV